METRPILGGVSPLIGRDTLKAHSQTVQIISHIRQKWSVLTEKFETKGRIGGHYSAKLISALTAIIFSSLSTS